jgi:hypothetical protein
VDGDAVAARGQVADDRGADADGAAGHEGDGSFLFTSHATNEIKVSCKGAKAQKKEEVEY